MTETPHPRQTSPMRRFLLARSTRAAGLTVGLIVIVMLASWGWTATHPYDRDDYVFDETPAALARHGVQLRTDHIAQAPVAAATIDQLLPTASRIRGPLSIDDVASLQAEGGPDLIWAPDGRAVAAPSGSPGPIASVDVLIGLAWTSNHGEMIVSFAMPDGQTSPDFLYATDAGRIRDIGNLLYEPIVPGSELASPTE
jgi:hypothetical protein